MTSRNPPLALDRSFNVTKSYAEAVIDMAIAEKVAVADVWTDIWEAASKDERGLSKFLTDGLHLNAAGYEVSVS